MSEHCSESPRHTHAAVSPTGTHPRSMLPSDITGPAEANLHHTHVQTKRIVHIRKQLVLSIWDINKCHITFFNKMEKKLVFLLIRCSGHFLPSFLFLASPCCPDQYRGFSEWERHPEFFVSLGVLQKYHHAPSTVLEAGTTAPTSGRCGNIKISTGSIPPPAASGLHF